MNEAPPKFKPSTITITIDRKEAEAISLGLADLLCWLRGFEAARHGTELDRDGPMGINDLRNIRTKLNSELEK